MSFIPSVKCRLKQMRPLKWDRRRVEKKRAHEHIQHALWQNRKSLWKNEDFAPKLAAHTHTYTNINWHDSTAPFSSSNM